MVGRKREGRKGFWKSVFSYNVGPEWGLRRLWVVGHAAFWNCFPRFAPPTPSPHHISPGRVPAPQSLLQRTQSAHTQQPPGSLLKSYQPETNSAFQSNGIHVHGKQGLAALWVVKGSVLLWPLIKYPSDELWVSNVLFYIRQAFGICSPPPHTHLLAHWLGMESYSTFLRWLAYDTHCCQPKAIISVPDVVAPPGQTPAIAPCSWMIRRLCERKPQAPCRPCPSSPSHEPGQHLLPHHLPWLWTDSVSPLFL